MSSHFAKHFIGTATINVLMLFVTKAKGYPKDGHLSLLLLIARDYLQINRHGGSFRTFCVCDRYFPGIFVFSKQLPNMVPYCYNMGSILSSNYLAVTIGNCNMKLLNNHNMLP